MMEKLEDLVIVLSRTGFMVGSRPVFTTAIYDDLEVLQELSDELLESELKEYGSSYDSDMRDTYGDIVDLSKTVKDLIPMFDHFRREKFDINYPNFSRLWAKLEALYFGMVKRSASYEAHNLIVSQSLSLTMRNLDWYLSSDIAFKNIEDYKNHFVSFMTKYVELLESFNASQSSDITIREIGAEMPELYEEIFQKLGLPNPISVATAVAPTSSSTSPGIVKSSVFSNRDEEVNCNNLISSVIQGIYRELTVSEVLENANSIKLIELPLVQAYETVAVPRDKNYEFNSRLLKYIVSAASLAYQKTFSKENIYHEDLESYRRTLEQAVVANFNDSNQPAGQDKGFILQSYKDSYQQVILSAVVKAFPVFRE